LHRPHHGWLVGHRPRDRAVAKNRNEIRIGIVKALGFLVRVSPSLASRVVTSSGQIEP
jgi:hypothetical protein